METIKQTVDAIIARSVRLDDRSLVEPQVRGPLTALLKLGMIEGLLRGYHLTPDHAKRPETILRMIRQALDEE